MAALDDALNNPTVAHVPPKLIIDWVKGSEDASRQVGRSFKVEHSLDDGLPDEVSSTSSVAGSGTLQLPDVVGIPPARVASWGIRTPSYESDSNTNALLLNVDGSTFQQGDYLLVFVGFYGTLANITLDVNHDNNLVNLTGWISDGADFHSSIWGIEIHPDNFEPGSSYFISLWYNGSFNPSLGVAAVWARDNTGRPLRLNPSSADILAETGSSLSHVAPMAELTRRGIVLNSWLRNGSVPTWTPPVGSTELFETAIAANLNLNTTLAVSYSGLLEAGEYTFTGTTHSAAAVALMGSVGLEILEHDGMDARQYFSPFNKNSPIVDEPRDLAPMTFDFGVVTENGPEYVRLFTGQMSDVQIQGRQAEITGVSSTRLALMQSVKPPTIWARQGGANATTLLTWVAQACSLFVSPAPSFYTRSWIPGHGSMHDMLGYSYDITTPYVYQAGLETSYRLADSENLTVLEGPFVAGLFAEQTASRAIELSWNLKPLKGRHPIHAPLDIYYHDLIANSNAKGRLSMWVRGDSWAVNPTAYVVSSGTQQVHFGIKLVDASPFANRVQFEVGIMHDTRQMFCRFRDMTPNDSTHSSFITLPEDGEWHFVSWGWDWKSGMIKYHMDGVDQSAGPFATNDTLLAGTVEWEAWYEFAGNNVQVDLSSRLPVAEIHLEAGIESYDTPSYHARGTDFVPDIVARTIDVELQVIAYPNMVEAWSIIEDLARASLSSYRINEEDQLMFLPLDYFGQDEQLAIVGSVDTELNTEDLDVRVDPVKIRNRVTVEFEETRVDSIGTHVLQYKTVEVLPPGTSVRTYPLDIPMAAPRWSIVPGTPSAQLDNLTSGTIATGQFAAIDNFVTINSTDSGSGTYQTVSNVKAEVLSYDSFSVTIQFTNYTGSPKFLTNNGDDFPFLGIKGFAIRTGTGYETRSDEASIAKRRERALTAQLPILQRRVDATQMASRLVNMLCQPKPELRASVFGDPQLKPGQIIVVYDWEGSQAEGMWRVLSVSHNRDGASYKQDLVLRFQQDKAYWDESGPGWEDRGWDGGVWGE